MTREEVETLVFDTYGVRADYPFKEDFETGVFAIRIAESGLDLQCGSTRKNSENNQICKQKLSI